MSSTFLSRASATRKRPTRFFKKLLKGLRYAPRVMITDKLASYGAARKQMLLSIEHRQHKGLNIGRRIRINRRDRRSGR